MKCGCSVSRPDKTPARHFPLPFCFPFKSPEVTYQSRPTLNTSLRRNVTRPIQSPESNLDFSDFLHFSELTRHTGTPDELISLVVFGQLAARDFSATPSSLVSVGPALSNAPRRAQSINASEGARCECVFASSCKPSTTF